MYEGSGLGEWCSEGMVRQLVGGGSKSSVVEWMEP